MNKPQIKKLAKELSLPLILLLLYLILSNFQKYISSSADIGFVTLLVDFINNQSLFAIFLIALIEGGFILGQYAPGSLVLFLSIISAQGDITKISILLSVISVAFILAYSFDYLIGYYGLNRLVKKFGLEKHLLKAEKLLHKNVFSAMFFTYWDSNLASLLAVSSGSLKIPFKKFISYSIIFVIFWNLVWGTLLYFFGDLVLSLVGPKYILIVLSIWTLWILYKNFFIKEEVSQLESIPKEII